MKSNEYKKTINIFSLNLNIGYISDKIRLYYVNNLFNFVLSSRNQLVFISDEENENVAFTKNRPVL